MLKITHKKSSNFRTLKEIEDIRKVVHNETVPCVPDLQAKLVSFCQDASRL